MWFHALIAKYVIGARIWSYFFHFQVVSSQHFYHSCCFYLIVEILVSGCTAPCWSGVHLQHFFVLFLTIKHHKADFSLRTENVAFRADGFPETSDCLFSSTLPWLQQNRPSAPALWFRIAFSLVFLISCLILSPRLRRSKVYSVKAKFSSP